MTDEQALEHARFFALRAGRMGEHQYLPRDAHTASTMEPHQWVLDAIAAAAYGNDELRKAVTALTENLREQRADAAALIIARSEAEYGYAIPEHIQAAAWLLGRDA